MITRVFRLVAGLAIAFAVLTGTLIAATPVNIEMGFSFGDLVVDTSPSLLAILLAGLTAAWLATDARGVAIAMAWLGGRRTEADAPVASRALASASRAAVSAGMVLSIAALIFIVSFVSATQSGQESPSPSFLANGLTTGMLGPFWALLVGRCWIGSHAARAALAAGERPGRTLRGWSELSVPLMLAIIPALLLLTSLFNYQPIAR